MTTTSFNPTNPTGGDDSFAHFIRAAREGEAAAKAEVAAALGLSVPAGTPRGCSGQVELAVKLSEFEVTSYLLAARLLIRALRDRPPRGVG